MPFPSSGTCNDALALLSRARSRADVPPQIPKTSPPSIGARASSRHCSRTGHLAHSALAGSRLSPWSGKNTAVISPSACRAGLPRRPGPDDLLEGRRRVPVAEKQQIERVPPLGKLEVVLEEGHAPGRSLIIRSRVRGEHTRERYPLLKPLVWLCVARLGRRTRSAGYLKHHAAGCEAPGRSWSEGKMAEVPGAGKVRSG